VFVLVLAFVPWLLAALMPWLMLPR